MAMIYVKSKPDRRAYYEGRIIPTDKFVPVTDDPYIRRLVDHWGDLEVEGGAAKPAEAKPQSGRGVTGAPPKQAAGPTAEPAPRPAATQPNQPSQAPAPGTGAPTKLS